MSKATNLVRPWLCFVPMGITILLLSLLLIQNCNKMLFIEQRPEFSKDFEVFMEDWCRERETRTSLDIVIGSCRDQIKWSNRRPGIPTSAAASFIFSWSLKPAGQFSRFFIQAVSGNGKVKTTGGDWWRILIRGVSNMRPTVFDLGNGTYEVLFLVVEPGIYSVEIVLDYTLCDGFRDPPDNWFVIGNAQGKMQPDGVLQGHAKKDFRLERFQKGREIMINVRLPTDKGLYLFNVLPTEVFSNLRYRHNFRCGMKCNLIWDGYGRWSGKEWKPYLKARRTEDKVRKSVVNKTKGSLYNTLWIYGDSQARRMYDEVKNTTLCREIFKSCKLSRNWVYTYTVEFPPQDDFDFDYRIITNDIKKVLERPEMSENSVMVLNLGLHYLQSTNFSNYIKLLRTVVGLFKDSETNRRSRVRMIWKTSTPLSKEKDVEDYLYSDSKRFLNNPRVAMFNAYATSLMCNEGFEILDIHPLTASYPHGTGGPKMEFYKEHDIVHFRHHVMAPFQEALAEYLVGNLSKELSIENYQFF